MRLHLLVEGQSEEAFVRRVLAEHLRGRVELRVRLLTTKGGRGGVSSYSRIRRDLLGWFREEPGHDCRFTTLLDAYGLPGDFPNQTAARRLADPYARVLLLESAFAEDLGEPRFLPYLQLHEFEALLLSHPAEFLGMYPGHAEAVKRLERTCKDAGGPERINFDTPPSRRIRDCIPGYRKVASAAQIAEAVGLERMRSRCLHFSEWLTRLEGFTPTSS